MAERAELGTPLGQAEACTTNEETDRSAVPLSGTHQGTADGGTLNHKAEIGKG